MHFTPQRDYVSASWWAQQNSAQIQPTYMIENVGSAVWTFGLWNILSPVPWIVQPGTMNVTG